MPSSQDLFNPRRFARRLVRSLIFIAAAFCVLMFGYAVLVHYAMSFRDLGYDTDAWFILAAGDYITHNGIPYENPWALVDGLHIVVQQWLHDCIIWLLYSENGFSGIRWFQVAMFAAVGASLFAACRCLSKKTGAAALLAAVGVSIAGVYISARPTSWTMLSLIATVAICCSYREDPKAYKLALLLAVQVVAANMQISMAPIVFLSAAAFLVPSASVIARPVAFAGRYAAEPERDARAIAFRFIRVELKGHLRSIWPLAVAVALCVGAMLANPYGVDGALYLLRGVGQASYGSYISELQPGWADSTLVSGAFYAALFFSPLVLTALLWRRRALAALADDAALIPLSILWVAGQVGYALAIRNIWIAALTSALLAARLVSHMPSVKPDRPRVFDALDRLPACIPITVCLIAFIAAPVAASRVSAAYGPDMGGMFANVDSPAQGQQTQAMKERFEDVQSQYGPLVSACISWRKIEGRDPAIYMENPVAYSYLEFRGLKVPFDMRPEIWGAAIAGEKSTEPYKAWVDAKKSNDMNAYIADGGWDFLIVSPNEAEEMCELVGGRVVVETASASLVSCPPAGVR